MSQKVIIILLWRISLLCIEFYISGLLSLNFLFVYLIFMRIFCNSYPCTTINKLHTLTSFKKIFGSGLSLHILFLIFFLIGIYPDFAMFSEIKASDLYLPLILSVSSVAQSCLTLCDPMECRTPGFHVHHQLLELTQTHIRWVSDGIQPSHPLLFPLYVALIFPSIRVFSNESALQSGGQSIGVSASTSVLPMNIQDWFPLGWTGWLSLQSNGLSRVFAKTTVQKHQFFGVQLSLLSNSHIYTWTLEKP